MALLLVPLSCPSWWAKPVAEYHATRPARCGRRAGIAALSGGEDVNPLPLTLLQRQRTSVRDVESYRALLAGGVEYKRLDVRGDSAPLLPRDGARPPQHPVAAALHARRAGGSRPGARDDGHKIALAIEGGGMRGCVAAGMGAALHHLNLTDCVDVVYGSSAGSLVGAYLLTRQVPLFGGSIYYETLPTAGRAFIDLRNVLRSLGLGAMRFTPTGLKELMSTRLGTPVLNLDFLLEEVVQRRKPLDWEAFLAVQSTQPLRVVASDVTDERARTFGAAEGAFDSLPGLVNCMRASMLLPGICGPVVPLRRPTRATDAVPEYNSHADAMLFEPIPYRSAVAEGATHVLVLRTRPDGTNVVKKPSVFERLIAHRFFRRKMRMPRMAAHMIDQRHRRRYAEDILILNAGAASIEPTALGNQGGSDAADGYGEVPLAAHLLPIALQPGERGPEVDNLQTDPREIFHAVRCGFARAYELLAPEEEAQPDGWRVATEVFPDTVLEAIVDEQRRAHTRKRENSKGSVPKGDGAQTGPRSMEAVDEELRGKLEALALLEEEIRRLEAERGELETARQRDGDEGDMA